LDNVGRRLEDVEKEKVNRQTLMQGTDNDKAMAVRSFGYLLKRIRKFTAQTEEMLRNLGPNPVTKASEEFSELLGKLTDSLAKKIFFDAVKSKDTIEYNMSKLDQVWRACLPGTPRWCIYPMVADGKPHNAVTSLHLLISCRISLFYFFCPPGFVWPDGLAECDPKSKASKTKRMMRTDVRDNLEEFQTFNISLRFHLESGIVQGEE
jgi:hypothetical protein